jgi:DNA adenine methylase
VIKTKSKLIKSPLKWAGGKSSIVPKLMEIWENHRDMRYVDLFAGSAVIPLNLQPKSCVINDSNIHLIDFWRHIKSIPKMMKDIPLLPIELQNNEESYYQTRYRFNKYPTAAGFYYLNRTCFNGLCRYNKKGQFNVPYGKYKNVNYITDFSEYQNIIKDWVFLSLDFASLPLDKKDFVFADPPYDDGFTSYTDTGFNWKEQVLLAEKLASHSGISIATNKATTRIIDLYTDLGFDIEIVSMPRRISCDGNRKPVDEMFATKNIK